MQLHIGGRSKGNSTPPNSGACFPSTKGAISLLLSEETNSCLWSLLAHQSKYWPLRLLRITSGFSQFFSSCPSILNFPETVGFSFPAFHCHITVPFQPCMLFCLPLLALSFLVSFARILSLPPLLSFLFLLSLTIKFCLLAMFSVLHPLSAPDSSRFLQLHFPRIYNKHLPFNPTLEANVFCLYIWCRNSVYTVGLQHLYKSKTAQKL